MAHIPSMIEYLLGKDKEPFMEFAFGKVYQDLPHKNFVTLWNSRHDDNLTLLKYGRPEEDLHKMIALWKYYKKFISKNRCKQV